MKLLEYRKLRSGVQMNARPTTAAERRAVALDLERELLRTGCFADVEVDHTDNLDHLVVAMCTYDPTMLERHVALRLEEMWNNRLRFTYWAVHSTLVEKGQVELQGATLSNLGGPYVTLHVVAQKGPIPAQRGAVD